MKFRPGVVPPVAEQARLDVATQQRFAQQRVLEQIDLADREVVGGAPVGVNPLTELRIQYCGFHGHETLQAFERWKVLWQAGQQLSGGLFDGGFEGNGVFLQRFVR